MSEALLVVGIVGILGMTWLFPVIALLLWKITHTQNSEQTADNSVSGNHIPCGEAARGARVSSLAILVPAHNEEQTLEATLKSIFDAVQAALSVFPGLRVEVVVGIDGSRDNTKRITENFPVRVCENVTAQGKWRTLREMVGRCPDAEWIAFADAGILWKSDLLIKLLPHCAEPQVAGVAPTYKNPEGGVVENLLWAVERHFKSIECEAGGPITMHGATVFYKRQRLVEAYEELGQKPWLNDDVVIPLCIRTLHPAEEIRYLPEVEVSEQPRVMKQQKMNREYVRRRRMVLGNVEWISAFLPKTWDQAPIVATLALRRVFRLFWAYWGVAVLGALTLSAAMALPRTVMLYGIFGLIFTSIVAYSASRSARVLAGAASASIAAPFYLLFRRHWVQSRLNSTVWR